MQTNIGTHVENRRLVEAAAGRHQLKEWEQKHLHECEICQGVFYVFINQPFTPREFETQTENPQEPPLAS